MPEYKTIIIDPFTVREPNIIHEGRNGTYVEVTDEPDAAAGGACHEYDVRVRCWQQHGGEGWQSARNKNIQYLQGIHFQHGPIATAGVNGVQTEHLIAILQHRFAGFQAGNFACDSNAAILQHLDAIMALCDARTADRVARKVEGKDEA